jgi:DNA-binding MarR family transcriptional regulator
MTMIKTLSLAEVSKSIETGSVQFSYCSAYKTRQLAKLVMMHFESTIKSLNLKGTQFSLLGFVDRDGPIQPTELASIMGLSTSTLSRNMQPLIAQGFLVVSAGVDARSRILALTPSGKQLFLRASKRWQEAQKALGTQIGVKDLAALHCMIDNVIGRFSSDRSEAV